MPRTLRFATLGGAMLLVFLSACQGGQAVATNEPAAIGAQSAAIVAGEPAPAAISVVAVLNALDSSLCTGAVISERMVLTAKHCVQGPGESGPVSPDALGIVLSADLDSADASAVIDVIDIVTTPGTYTDSAESLSTDLLGHDLALLTLARPAGVPQLAVQLGSPVENLGQPALAVGYGITPSSPAGVRMQVDTTVIGMDRVSLHVEGTVCQGDSGGPLLDAHGVIIGVVSVGVAEDCGEGGTSYYQRLDLYAHSIRAAVAEANGCLSSGAEHCDGADNDCDGELDEGCTGSALECDGGSDCELGTLGTGCPDGVGCADASAGPDTPDAVEGPDSTHTSGCSLGPAQAAHGWLWLGLLSLRTVRVRRGRTRA